jgi:hypothetical protein
MPGPPSSEKERSSLLAATPAGPALLLAALRAGEAVGLGADRLVLGEVALDDAALAVDGRRGEVQAVPALRGLQTLRADLRPRAPAWAGTASPFSRDGLASSTGTSSTCCSTWTSRLNR